MIKIKDYQLAKKLTEKLIYGGTITRLEMRGTENLVEQNIREIKNNCCQILRQFKNK